jgi:hypothetical protein
MVHGSLLCLSGELAPRTIPLLLGSSAIPFLLSTKHRSLLKTQKASGFANGIDDLHLPKLELVQKLLSRGKSLWFNASPIHQI